MKAIKQMIRGCRTLPNVGAHPGTDWLLMFLAMGALAGARGGLYGALGGAAFMAVFIAPMYLAGAYRRANDSDRLTAAPSNQSQGGDK